MLLAVLLDWRYGEIKNHHPLIYFGTFANKTEQLLNLFKQHSSLQSRSVGVIAVITLTIVPALILEAIISGIDDISTTLAVTVQIIGLYFCLGRQSLHEHAMNIYRPLKIGDLTEARKAVSMIVSRETADMSSKEVTTATVESILENSNDACFATLFWFVIGGLPLALLHRLSNTLDAMWGYRTERYNNFGWAAAKFDDLLNWIPARLGALSLAFLGHRQDALNCWKNQAKHYPSPNGGVIMSTGAGALNIKLGGDAIYHGVRKQRTVLGCGRDVIAADIPRASSLVNHAVIAWLGATAVIEGVCLWLL